MKINIKKATEYLKREIEKFADCEIISDSVLKSKDYNWSITLSSCNAKFKSGLRKQVDFSYKEISVLESLIDYAKLDSIPQNRRNNVIWK